MARSKTINVKGTEITLIFDQKNDNISMTFTLCFIKDIRI